MRYLYIALVLAAAAGAQTWTQLNPVGPTPSGAGHTSVSYDPGSNRLIIFGGGTPDIGSGTNATWVLTNANGLGGTPTWTQLIPTGPLPPRRMFHTGVYDSSTNRLIIFGGTVTHSAIYNDVWVLTNANGLGGTPEWIQLAPTGTAPTPRLWHSAVYDPTSNRMIVFGGCDTVPFCNQLNDTWVLSNANGLVGPQQWQLVPPSGGQPPARAAHNAEFDPATNRMVVFGGGSTFTIYNDTWLLNGANGLGGTPYWTQLNAGNPPPRYNAPSGYDSGLNQLIVTHGITGGHCCGQSTQDTWSLSPGNGTGTSVWQQLTVAGVRPPPRDSSHHTGAIDVVNHRFIIFGGTDTSGAALNDVWVLAYSTVSDTTPPQITSSISPTPANGWNRAATTVTWSLTDPESAIASSSGCNATMLTAETAGTTLTCSATNGGGLTNSASETVRIDLTPPSVAITSPPANSTAIVGSTGTLNYTCSDVLSGVASCTGPVPNGGTLTYSAVGAQSFTVNSADVAGNTSSASVSVTVAYNFTGFLNPIQNLPVINSVRAGQSVPVKWQLRNAAGQYISDLSTFTSLTASPIACDSSPVSIVGDSVDASGGSVLRYDTASNQFVYNWQTPSSSAGCWALQLTLRDGTTHLAKFTLR